MTMQNMKDKIEEDMKTSVISELGKALRQLDRENNTLNEDDGRSVRHAIMRQSIKLGEIKLDTIKKLHDTSYRKAFNIYASKTQHFNVVDRIAFANHGLEINKILDVVKEIKEILNEEKVHRNDASAAYATKYKKTREEMANKNKRKKTANKR